MSALAISITAFIAFAISLILTIIFANPAHKLQIIDHPNERSLHTIPVSRIGGLAICAAIIITAPYPAISLPSNVNLIAITIGAVIISVISFFDDRFSLNAGIRLLAHISVAAFIVHAGFSLTVLSLPLWEWRWPIEVGVIISLLYIVWLINLYNFMDGMDGFAGGMAVIGFVTFAILGLQANNMIFAVLCLVIASSALGFLVFNFPPAKIFMGDVGSSTLGFLVAAFSLWANNGGIFPLWIAVLIFCPFIIDATITLFRRLMGGEKVWEAHKSHYYQRLVQAGWGHRRTVLWEYLLMILCGGSAYVAVKMGDAQQLVILIIWLMVYGLLVYYINRVERRHKKGVCQPNKG